MRVYQLILIIIYFASTSYAIYDFICTYREDVKFYKENKWHNPTDPTEFTKAVIVLHILAVVVGIMYLLIEVIDWSFLNKTI